MFTKTPHPETCERCPNRYSANGCPCWITPENGFIEQNVVSKEERIVTGCFYQVVPKLMMHVVQAANGAAASADGARNRLVEGFVALASLPAPPIALTLEEPDGEATED